MHAANSPSNKGLSRAVEGAVESHERGVEIGNHVYTQQVAASGHLGTEILMHHQEDGVRQPPDSFASFQSYKHHLTGTLSIPVPSIRFDLLITRRTLTSLPSLRT